MQKLSESAIAARREYQKAWRKKNPDKVQRSNAAYWERIAAKLKEENAEANDGK